MIRESRLDYAPARYYSKQQGRFTSVDGKSANVLNPQTFNRYSYVLNNPTNMTDPSGMMGMIPDATTRWRDVADTFWGTSANWGSPPPSAGHAIISNGMNGFSDRQGEAEEGGGTEPNLGEILAVSLIDPTAPVPEQSSADTLGTILIIVGDPGLGEHNQGSNFDRAAETKRTSS